MCRVPWLVFLGQLLEDVPLCNRTARVGQHVAPVTQFRTRRVTAEYDATDGIRRADPIIVNHCDDQLNFLPSS